MCFSSPRKDKRVRIVLVGAVTSQLPRPLRTDMPGLWLHRRGENPVQKFTAHFYKAEFRTMCRSIDLHESGGRSLSPYKDKINILLQIARYSSNSSDSLKPIFHIICHVHRTENTSGTSHMHNVRGTFHILPGANHHYHWPMYFRFQI